MKYRKKDISANLQDKNWEGIKPFLDRYGMKCFLQLDRIVADKDLDKLKAYVRQYGIDPVVEYDMPVGGEGVKELYEIAERYHAHKRKVGAEWWLRDEVEDLVRQLRGHAGEAALRERVALLWKDVDNQVEAPAEIKVSAFRKVLMLQLVRGLCRPEFTEEKAAMERMIEMSERSGLAASVRPDDDFAE